MPAAPRVLVLEDEPLIAVMVRDWLTELGCDPVGPAHTVPSALAFIQGGLLDGAVLDVTLGDQDCAAVADALRQRSVPFAFATGGEVETWSARYPDVPALTKPYDFESLRALLSELLGTHARS